MKKETGLLAFILLISIALRSIGLESRSIWYDDAFSIFLSQQNLPDIIRGTAADTMPPLYYFVLHFWMQISTQIWFLRLPGVLFSVGSVLLLYLLTSRLFNRRAGLAAAFVAAISPFQIYHAQELRSYALLALCELGYFLFFSQLWQEETRYAKWSWLGLIGCGTAAMYSHNLAAFVLVVPDFILLIRQEWQFLRRLMAAQIVIGLAALPWLLYLPGQIAKIQSAWSIPRPGPVELLQSLVISTGNLPLPGIWLAAVLLISMWVLVLLIFELIHDHVWNPGLLLLAALATVPPALMLVVSYLVKPVFVTRGFIVSILAYAGLVGYIIARRWPQMGMVFAGLFIAGSIITLPYQWNFQDFPRSPFREAVDYLQEEVQPGDRIVHDNKLSQFPMHYYAPGLPQAFLKDIPGGHNDTLSPFSEEAMHIFASSDLPAAAEGARRIYFVVFTQAIQEYQALGQPGHPGLVWLRNTYQQTGHQVYNDLEIYRFDRLNTASGSLP